MNKGELVERVAKRTNITQKDADLVIRNMLEVVVESVSEGKRVSIPGFGSFQKSYRKSRKGRNPQTGEKIEIPEKFIPIFNAGKSFKQRVGDNNGS